MGRLKCVCATVVLVLALCLTGSWAELTETTTIVTDKTCLGGGDINTLAVLPRRGKAFTDVSANWGDYPGWWDCTGAPTNRSCSEVTPSGSDLIDEKDARAPYFEGLVLHVALGILMAVLCVFFLSCFIVFRYCCCCCCRKSQRCKCGGKYPLPRSGSCCSLGYQLLRAAAPPSKESSTTLAKPTQAVVPEQPAPIGGTTHPDDAKVIMDGAVVADPNAPAPAADGTGATDAAAAAAAAATTTTTTPSPTVPNSAGEFGYAKAGRRCSLCYLLSFLLCVILFVLLGEFNGNRAVIDAAKTVSRSPTAAMNLVRGTVDPLGDFMQNMAATTLRTLLDDVTNIVNNATDVRVLRDELSTVLLEIDRFPDINEMVTVVNTVDVSISSLDTTLDGLQGDLRHVGAVLDVMSTQADTVDTLVSDFEGQLTDLNVATSQLNVTLDSIEDIQQEFAADPFGRAVVMEAYLIQIQAKWPSADDIASVTTLIDDIQAGDMTDGGTEDSAEEVARNWYIGNATALRRQFQDELPNLATVATTADDFNTAAEATLSSGLQSVFDDLDAAETALNAIVSTAVMNATFRGVLNSTNSLQLDVLNNTLKTADYQIQNLVDFDYVRRLLTRVQLVDNAIPAMQAAADELLGLNDTVVSLPDELTEILDLATELNDTLAPTLVEIDSILLDLNSTEEQIENITISVYVDEVTRAQVRVDNAVVNIDITSLDADMAAIDDNRNVDFAGIRADVEAFNGTLATARVPEALIAALRNFEVTRQELIRLLGKTSGDIFIMDGGFCSTSNGTYCKDEEPDHACTGVGNFCTARGEARCRFDQTVTCSLADPSPCGIGADYCLLHDAELEELKFQLALADGNRTLVLPVAAVAEQQMRVLINDSNFDLGSLKADLNGAIDASSGVDTAGLGDSADSMRDAVGAVDIAEYTRAVQDASAEIRQTDFGDVLTQLEDFNSTITDFKGDKRDFVVDGVNGSNALAGILFDRMGGYLADLSFESLSTIRADEGLAGMTRQIVDIPDDATNFISDTTDLFSERLTLRQDLEDDDIFRLLDVLSLSQYADAGSLYFFGQLMFEDDMVDVDDPTLNTVFKDTSDEEYPDGKKCWTSACIDASLEQANNEPLNEYSAIPVPMTAQDLMSTMWVIPVIVVLLGLWGLCCFGCCCKKRDNGASWQKVPVSCMTGVICCQMPCLFLFTALLVPIMMLYADTCTGMANVGMQWVDGMQDTLCVSDDYMGGVGTYRACTYDTGVRDDRRLNFTVDLREMYVTLMSECGSSNPYAPIWEGIERTAAPIPLDIVNEFLDDMDAEVNATFVLREPMRDALRRAAATTGDNIVTLARGLSTAVDCDAIHDSFHEVKEALCCDVLTAFYWIVAAWYLIAWAYCACGCCSGLLARKRLAARPWGKVYEENVFVTPNAALVNEQYAPQSPMGLVDPDDMARFGGAGGGVVTGDHMAGMVAAPGEPGYGGVNGSGIPVSDAGPMYPNTYVDDLDKPTGRYADV